MHGIPIQDELQILNCKIRDRAARLFTARTGGKREPLRPLIPERPELLVTKPRNKFARSFILGRLTSSFLHILKADHLLNIPK